MKGSSIARYRMSISSKATLLGSASASEEGDPGFLAGRLDVISP